MSIPHPRLGHAANPASPGLDERAAPASGATLRGAMEPDPLTRSLAVPLWALLHPLNVDEALLWPWSSPAWRRSPPARPWRTCSWPRAPTAVARIGLLAPGALV